MSSQFGKLCSLILQEYFGEIVQKVGYNLFKWGPKPLNLIASNTGLPLGKTKQALCVLIQYGLVSFGPGKVPEIPEYDLLSQKVILFLRYPRYLYLIKQLYGDEAEMLVEELLRHGQDTLSRVMVRAAKRLNEAMEGQNKSVSVTVLRDKFNNLVTNQFIQRCPSPTEQGTPTIPVLKVKEGELYLPPDLEIKDLAVKVQSRTEDFGTQPDDGIYWRINFDRFHQEFRDQIMVSAITRRIDENGGELMKHLLKLMYHRTEAWAGSSNPIPFTEIKESIRKQGTHPNLMQYLDQYLKILEDDSTKFVNKVGDSGGGQFSVNVKNAFLQLTWATVENVVLERFGSKAARIFRCVKIKKHLEQDQIQELGMIPAKEAKLLTYNLLQENFLQLQELRKSLSNTGPNKSFFLFHIELNQVVRMVLEMCYKALYNIMTRMDHERTENRRMIEKQQRIDSIMHNMKEQGASEEQLTEIEEMLTPPERALLEKVREMSDKLNHSEIQLDETIFLLQLFLYYQQDKL